MAETILLLGCTGLIGASVTNVLRSFDDVELYGCRKASFEGAEIICKVCNATKYNNAAVFQLSRLAPTVVIFASGPVIHYNASIEDARAALLDHYYPAYRVMRDLQIGNLESCIYIGSSLEWLVERRISKDELRNCAESPSPKKLLRLAKHSEVSIYPLVKTIVGISIQLNAEKFGVRYTNLRTSQVYTFECDKKGIVSKLLTCLRDGQTLKVVNANAVRDYMHVADAAFAISQHVLTPEKVPVGINPLGSGYRCSIKDLAGMIESTAGNEFLLEENRMITPNTEMRFLTHLNDPDCDFTNIYGKKPLSIAEELPFALKSIL